MACVRIAVGEINMASKRKNGLQAQSKNTKAKESEAKLLRHISRLGLRTKEAYKDWCLQHGFSTQFTKSALLRQRELDKHALHLSQERLRQHSRESKLHIQIMRISKGEVDPADLGCEILIEIASSFKKCKTPELLCETLLFLERRSKLLSEPYYVRGIVALVRHHASWKRPLKQWRGQKHNASRQFSSLIRHLIAMYDVPVFMDDVWLSGKKKQQHWFVHIGNGNNIRTATGLPVSLTKKMAHHYLQAPDNYSVLEAFRWAQIQSLGGDKALCDSIAVTQLGRRFKDDEFWLSVIRFFINTPMFDRAQVHPIIDYIWNEKHVDVYDYNAQGNWINTGPTQPNFTMRGRSMATLLDQVEAWHQRLGRCTHSNSASRWQRWVVDNFRLVEGTESADTYRVWSIRELLTSHELIAEGRKQKHCVASYASSCVNGHTSIFTMDMCDYEGERKLLTIEVGRRMRTVYQVRGRRNRLPTKTEALVVRRWVEHNDLKWEDSQL